MTSLREGRARESTKPKNARSCASGDGTKALAEDQRGEDDEILATDSAGGRETAADGGRCWERHALAE